MKTKTRVARDTRDQVDPEGATDTANAGIGDAVATQLAKLLARPLGGGLYLVATPIGHLGDTTFRVITTIAQASLVYCEDTRHSRKLLSAYGIKRKLLAYHDFSDERDRDLIIAALHEGKSVALLSDAGTPLIADPGYKLVREAQGRNLPVFAVPGPCALIAAVVSSGLPTDEFFFGGFMPSKEAGRVSRIDELSTIPGTIIVYETGPRLKATLTALQARLPDRTIIVARELTKLNETITEGTPQQLLDGLQPESVLGEIVLLIAPAKTARATEADIAQALGLALKTKSLSDAVEDVRTGLGAPRKMVYNLALKLRS